MLHNRKQFLCLLFVSLLVASFASCSWAQGTITVDNMDGSSNPNGTVGEYYDVMFDIEGWTLPYSAHWSFSGSVPGLSFGDQQLQGTPTKAGIYSVTIRVMDMTGDNGEASRPLSINISNGSNSGSTSSSSSGGCNSGMVAFGAVLAMLFTFRKSRR